MENPIIECKNISFRYDKQSTNAVIESLTLSINQGEFIGIVGANGSGKSTLAKMFNALLVPDEGEVIVFGNSTSDIEKVQEIRQQVGMVFQNPDNQIVATIVEEDVAFGPENLGIEPQEIRARVDEALRTVNMYEYRMHAPHLLSGGQKQRLAIAGVLAIAPRVLIMDEATAMLDPNGRREVMDTIQKLHREQHITVIHITHHMSEIVNADRVLVMSKGRIVMDEEPRKVFSLGDKLQEYDLDVPQVTALASNLQSLGVQLPSDILSVEEMVEALCRLK